MQYKMDIGALVQWVGGSVSPKVEVRDTAASGRGVYCVAPIGRGEEIVCVPHARLLNRETVLAHLKNTKGSERLQRLSSFQLVSMFLVSQGPDLEWLPFLQMLPTLEELGGAPIVWRLLQRPGHEDMWRLLPRSARRHTEQVISRFERDEKVVLSLVTASRTRLLWAWMCVNLRCLYMAMPLATEPADNFTMVPYADFLNHSDSDHCAIAVTRHGFHVTTTLEYAPGDEVLFSYGPHGNEFLLCEYGFVLARNKWNFVNVSEWILPLLLPAQSAFLKKHGYHGDYTVNTEVLFRTEVALAVLQERDPDLAPALAALLNGGENTHRRRSNVLLARILERIRHGCQALDGPIGVLHSDTAALCTAVLAKLT